MPQNGEPRERRAWLGPTKHWWYEKSSKPLAYWWWVSKVIWVLKNIYYTCPQTEVFHPCSCYCSLHQPSGRTLHSLSTWKRAALGKKVTPHASHQLKSVGGSEGKRESVYISPGQREVQVIFCTDMPSQKAPPLRGAGLVQVRERFCHPLPQRTLQADHSVQEDQPPFTERENGEGRKKGERFLLIAYYVQATVPGVVS